MAAVPNLIPEVTNGDCGSLGTVFLFTVIFAFPSAASESLPVISDVGKQKSKGAIRPFWN